MINKGRDVKEVELKYQDSTALSQHYSLRPRKETEGHYEQIV